MIKMANIVMMYIKMIKMRKIVEMMTMKQALCVYGMLRPNEDRWILPTVAFSFSLYFQPAKR